jgi:hypothetical protein
MFVIVHNNSVVLGPMRWNRFRFENFLVEELETTFTLPQKNESESPIVVSDEIKILTVVGTPDPAYNPKIEILYGPFWEFTETSAISSYQVWPMSIDAVKNMLKEQTAAERYTREISGTTVKINEVDYIFSTDRDTRNVIQNALISSQASFNWKLARDMWVMLTNTELQAILDAITMHVQECFDWEFDKIVEIDSCTTLTELDAVVIKEENTDGVI